MREGTFSDLGHNPNSTYPFWVSKDDKYKKRFPAGLEVEFDVKMLREDFNSDAPLIKVYNYILPTNCRYEDKGDIKFTLTTISNLLMSLKPDELNLQILKLKKDIDILSSNARLISSEDEVKSLSAYFKKDLFHSEIKELSARLKLQSFAISMAKDFEKLLVSSS